MVLFIKKIRIITTAMSLAVSSIAWGTFAAPNASAALAAASNGTVDATLLVEDYIMQGAGGTVRIPVGTYKISGTLVIPSNTQVVGAGEGVTVFLAAPTMSKSTIFAFGSISNPSSSSSLSQVTVNGLASAYVNAPNAAGVYIPSGSASCCLSNVEVKNVGFNGVGVHGQGDAVYNCWIHDNYGDGINMTGSFMTNLIPPTATSGNVLQNNTIRTNGLGQGSGGPTCYAINCGSMASNCLVQNNVISGNGILMYDSGQYDSGDSGNQLLSNRVVSADQAGIAVAGYESSFAVKDNVIIGPSAAGWGIAVTGPVSSGNIRDNKVGATSGCEPAKGGMIFAANASGQQPSSISVDSNHVTYAPATNPITVQSGCSNIVQANNVFIAGS